jgi:Family of unknown function (DUF6064)
MSEWWTYRLSDLILFSAHAYYRLIELYNAAIWPAQILALALGVGALGLARKHASGRWIAAILAVGWLWVAIAFHAARYATLNTAAPYFGWIFGMETALLLVFGWRVSFDRESRAGYAIFFFALFVMPFAAPVLGRGWRASEIFGIAPDPTAVGTLGLLLLARAKRRWMLFVLPVLWCVVSGAVLWALKSPDFWIPPLAAATAIGFGARQRP